MMVFLELQATYDFLFNSFHAFTLYSTMKEVHYCNTSRFFFFVREVRKKCLEIRIHLKRACINAILRLGTSDLALPSCKPILILASAQHYCPSNNTPH